MDPERWRRIRDVLDGALALTAEERPGYLNSECRGDASFRREIESLIRSNEEAGSFLESHAEAVIAQNGTGTFVDPWVGVRAGPYQIIERIGFGGMGWVYRAEDVKLGRDAAVKFLSPDMQRDAQARERFKREARAASALNHPHICTIYGVDEVDGHPYLAMELLKGQTLSNLIQGKALDVSRLLELAMPVLSALAAAHEAGIVHRDLKPSNIFVTDKGQVKILDFGLAKQVGLEAGTMETASLAESMLEPETLTNPGTALGTVSYMSPEQARGERLDARSDLFSFGAVLYEMATGHRAFPGQVIALVLDAILNRPPAPIAEANPLFPGKLEAIIRKTLEKDRERRYQSATAVLEDLHAFQQEWNAGTKSPAIVPWIASRRVSRWAVSTLFVLALLGAAGGYWLKLRNNPAVTPSELMRGTTRAPARPSVAVLGFENLTGRPEHAWLSTAFAEMLSTELSVGGRMRVVPGETVARASKELSLGKAQSYSKETLKKIRKDLGVDYVVMGSYFDAGKDGGGELRLDARLQDTRSGEVTASLPETGTESKLIELLSRTGADLRAKLGIGEMAGMDVTKVAATVPKDPMAARLYSEGLAKLRELDPGGARDSLVNAAAAEPNHPLIHAALAEAWSQLGYDEKSRSEARLAASLAEQLPQSDQLWVTGRFREATHEWDRAIDVYRTLLGFYPDNIEYGLRLAAVQTSAGRQKDALETIATMRKLPAPINSDPRIDLAEADADEISADFKHEKEVAQRALAEARNRGARLLAAKAQYAEAWAALNLGQMKDAEKFAEDARAAYISAGDKNGEANMLRTLGTVHLMQGDLAQAVSFYQASLRLAREVGNQYSQAAALNQIATALERQGKHDAALDAYQKALAIIREVGNKAAEGTALNNIANILWDRGDLGAARGLYEQAVLIARQLGDRSREAGSSVNIAHILFQQGDLKGAENQIEHSVPLAKEIGEQNIQAEAANSFGDVRLAQANFSDARQKYQEATSLRETLGDQLGLGETRISMAELQIAEDQPAQAEKLLQAAVDVFKKEKSQDDEMVAEGLLARALLKQGKVADARRTIDATRPRAMKVENPYVRGNFLIEAARVDAAMGKSAEARTALEAVLKTANEFGFVATQLKARLALAEVERKIDAGRSSDWLTSLQRDASSHGFMLIAQEAESLRTK